MWHRDPRTVFIRPNDQDFWATAWRSPEFQAIACDNADPYYPILTWAAAQPWWFVALNEPHERFHFGTWFAQALGQRTYANPLIYDLYLFHEILHARTFVDKPSGTYEEWRGRIRSNEICVSLETELLVYARHPEWRDRSFDFSIWADRVDLTPVDAGGPAQDTGDFDGLVAVPSQDADELFLYRSRGGVTTGENGQVISWPLSYPSTVDFPTFAHLWAKRREVACHPVPGDKVERCIALYEKSARRLTDAWKERWRQVEEDRISFQALCDAGQVDEAVSQRQTRWEETSDASGLPYGNEARMVARMPALA